MNKERIVPVFIGIGDLRLRAQFWNVESLAADEFLGMLFIEKCIRKGIPVECKTVPWHLSYVPIISTKKANSLLTAHDTVFHVNENCTMVLQDTSLISVGLCVREQYLHTGKYQC